jgi:hypothetical protein
MTPPKAEPITAEELAKGMRTYPMSEREIEQAQERCAKPGCDGRHCDPFVGPHYSNDCHQFVPPAPAQEQGGEAVYPCDRCGALRTKAEGGTTFTVCDACWDATAPKAEETEGERDAAFDAYLLDRFDVNTPEDLAKVATNLEIARCRCIWNDAWRAARRSRS